MTLDAQSNPPVTGDRRACMKCRREVPTHEVILGYCARCRHLQADDEHRRDDRRRAA